MQDELQPARQLAILAVKLHAISSLYNHGYQIGSVVCDTICAAVRLRSSGQKQLQDLQSELFLQVNREAIIRTQWLSSSLVAHLHLEGIV